MFPVVHSGKIIFIQHSYTKEKKVLADKSYSSYFFSLSSLPFFLFGCAAIVALSNTKWTMINKMFCSISFWAFRLIHWLIIIVIRLILRWMPEEEKKIVWPSTPANIQSPPSVGIAVCSLCRVFNIEWRIMIGFRIIADWNVIRSKFIHPSVSKE